jgi:hypothetical protein
MIQLAHMFVVFVEFSFVYSKIVETLSKLSRLDIAKRKKLVPFPMNSPVNYVNMPKDEDNSIVPTMRSLDDTVPIQE